MSEWTCSRTCDDMWAGRTFPTREEAVEDALRQHAAALRGEGTDLFDDDFPGPPKGSFLVGRLVEWRPHLDGYDLIEPAQYRACDECGEAGEDFLTDATNEQVDELTGLVQVMFDDWMRRHRLEPSWRMIEDIEEVKV